MKRKFILYPAVALALMTSASLSSCVDTDEPESITDLRKAVAQEVQANAGLLNAKAAVENAYVAVVNANAREAEAKAAQEEYKALKDKQDQELDAIKKKCEGDTLTAVAQQMIDKAKALLDAEIAKAKAKYEEANAQYKKAVEDAKKTVQEAELTVKRDMAKNLAEGVKSDLAEKLKTVNEKQKALTKAQEAQVNYFADNIENADTRQNLDKAVDVAKFDLDKAQKDLDRFNGALESRGISAFAELYKKYQDDVNAAEKQDEIFSAIKDSLNLILNKDLNPALKTATAAYSGVKGVDGCEKDGAKTEYDNKKAALEKGFQDKLDALEASKAKVGDIKFACSNALLQDLLGSTFTNFELKEGNYVNLKNEIEVKNGAKAVEDLRKAAQGVVDDLLDDYSRKYDGLVEKAKAGQAAAKTANDKAVEAWKKAVNALKGKESDEGKIDAVKDAAVDLFGTFATGDNWKLFSNIASYTADAAEMKKLLQNTGKFGEKITWAATGQGTYGAYQHALESANMDNINNCLDDAQALVKAIDAKVAEYTNTKKTLEDGKKAVAGTDEMKKLETAMKAAEDAMKAAEKAIEDHNAQYKKLYTDASAEFTKQKEKNEQMAKTYYAFAKDINDYLDDKHQLTDADQTKTDLFTIYAEYAKTSLENDLAEAQIAYEKAAQDLKDYDDGVFYNSDPAKAKEKEKELADAVKEAEEELATAQKEYNDLKGYYGIN